MKIKRRDLLILCLLLLSFFEVLYFFGRGKNRPLPAEIELPKEIAAVRETPEKELTVMGSSAALIPQELPSAAPLEIKQKKIKLTHSVKNVTGAGNVRVIAAKAGVEIKMTDRTSLGVEAGRKIHDTQDAAAWDQKVKDENEAQAKYKVLF